MTIPFVPNGVPAPAGTFPMPPGPATFNAQVPQQPVQVIQDQGWRGYPASQLPTAQPVQAPTPQSAAQPPQPQVQGYPQQYQQQPAQYQVGMPVQTQHAQPGTQPGQQFQPAVQPAQAPAGIDPNTILQGPSFPPELQGVTLGQAIQLYGGMRNLVLSLQQRQTQSVAAPQAQPQSTTPAPAPQQQGQPAFDWRNPGPSLAAVIGPMLDQALDRRLAPIAEQSAMQAANATRNAIAQEIGPQRFAQIEAPVMEYLRGASAQDLANPELWRVAVRTALGDQVLRGQQPQAPQGRPAQIPGSQPFVPGTPNPAPPLQSFFTESPQAGGQPVQGVTLTPTQMWFADQMGVPYATYAAYAQGVPPVLPPNGGRV